MTLSGALPVAGVGDEVSTALGATFAFELTASDAESVAPSSSVTVSLAVYVPGRVAVLLARRRRAVAAGDVLPSPKSSVQDAMLPSESELPEPLKVTLSGALPVAGVGDDVSTALGATFAFELTASDAESVAPLSSVTVSLAVYVPAA